MCRGWAKALWSCCCQGQEDSPSLLAVQLCNPVLWRKPEVPFLLCLEAWGTFPSAPNHPGLQVRKERLQVSGKKSSPYLLPFPFHSSLKGFQFEKPWAKWGQGAKGSVALACTSLFVVWKCIYEWNRYVDINGSAHFILFDPKKTCSRWGAWFSVRKDISPI